MGNRKKTEEVGIRGLQSISDLEVDIMNIVWEKKQITVREVHEILLKKEIAKKKEKTIIRKRGEEKWKYKPPINPNVGDRSFVADVVGNLLIPTHMLAGLDLSAPNVGVSARLSLLASTWN